MFSFILQYIVSSVDVDSDRVEFARKLGVYDEVYVSDIRAFDYADSFDAMIVIMSVHGFLTWGC